MATAGRGGAVCQRPFVSRARRIGHAVRAIRAGARAGTAPSRTVEQPNGVQGWISAVARAVPRQRHGHCQRMRPRARDILETVFHADISARHLPE